LVAWTLAPNGLPHGGETREASALRYSPARKPGSSPMSMWSHGRRASTGSVRVNLSGSTPAPASASSQRWNEKHSRQPFEPGPREVRPLEHLGHVAVAAGEQALEPALLLVVRLELEPVALGQLAQQLDLAVQVLDPLHRRPLERRVRLGHVLRDRHGHRRHARVQPERPRDLADAATGLRDADDVGLRLGRQPHDEVHLDAVVAALEDPPRRRSGCLRR
jgi:hypothetical protein